jgi:hypothetical protein
LKQFHDNDFEFVLRFLETADFQVIKHRREFETVFEDTRVVRKPIFPPEFHLYDRICDDGSREITKCPLQFGFIDLEAAETSDVFHIRRPHIEDEFEQIEWVNDDGEREIIERKKEFTLEYQNGMMLHREIPCDCYEYIELEDDAGDLQVIRRRTEYDVVHGIKRIRRYENEEYGYEERQDANGNRELVRVHRSFAPEDVLCDDGEFHKVRRVVYAPETEFVTEDGTTITEIPLQFQFVKQEVNGRIRRVRQQIRDDLYFFDEIKDEIMNRKTIQRKQRKYKIVQIDGKSVRQEVFYDEFEYEEDETKTIQKKKKVFVYSEEDGRRIRRQVRDDEYEYDMDDGEIIGKHRRLHRFVTIDGRQVRQEVIPDEFEYDEDRDVKLTLAYEHQTVEINDKTRRVRVRVPPEEDFEYILELGPNHQNTIVKKLKTFERHEDVLWNRVYRRQKVELEWTAVQNQDGSTNYVQVPRQVIRAKMMDKQGRIVEVLQPVEYEMIEVPGPDGSPILVRGRRKRGIRQKRVIRTFVAKWDIENGVLQRPSRRKTGRKKDLVVHEFGSLMQSQSGLSESIIAKLRERSNTKLVTDEEYEYDDPLDKFELDEDLCWRPRGDNRAFARFVFADALKRKIKRAELEVTISDIKFEIGNIRAVRRSIDHQMRLLMLNAKNKMKKCHCAFAVSEVTLEQLVHKVPCSHAGGQTRVVSDYFEDTNREIAANDEILERLPEIQKKLALSTEHHQLCLRQLEVNEETIDQITDVGDQLERRYRLVRPLEGQILLHPSVQRRLDLEQNVVQEKNDIVAIHQRTHKRGGDVRRLKCKIEDQKCVNDMLHKRIAEARRVKRPNVPLMWKSLEGMKKQVRLGAESVRVLLMEDACVKAVLMDRKSALTTQVLQDFAAELEELKEKVKKVMEVATKRWQAASEGNTRKLAIFARFQIEALEGLNNRLDAKIRALADEKFQLNSKAARMQRALVANKMELPDGFFKSLLPQ